jgi:hypothetical protein
VNYFRLYTNISLTQLERELRLVSVERRFQPMPCASLATFASVLSSVKVFMGSPVALYYLQKQSRVKASTGSLKIYPVLLTAYPAMAGGAAKTNSEGGESFLLSRRFLAPTKFIRDGNPDLFRTRRRQVY